MATNARQPIFHDDDDDTDSIATASTVASESEDTYDVERILAEIITPQGETRYLIKWTGYPLHRASYEPADNIIGRNILSDWEAAKRRVARGEEKYFDPDDWHAVHDAELQAKEDRHCRREKKREKRDARKRRLGLFVSPSGQSTSGQQSPVDSVELSEPTNQRLAHVTPLQAKVRRSISSPRGSSSVKKKGMATPVKRKRVVSDSPSEEDGTSETDTTTLTANTSSSTLRAVSDADQMRLGQSSSRSRTVDDLDQPASSVPPKSSKIMPTPIASTSISNLKATIPQPTISKPATLQPTVPQPTTTQSTVPQAQMTAPGKPPATEKNDNIPQLHPPASEGVGLSKRPAQGPLKKRQSTGSVFADWTSPAQQKYMRQSVSGETPRNSVDPQFRRLSVQNRYQKFSVNEAPPDFNQLTIVDPATGKTQPPKAQQPRPPTPEVRSATRSPEKENTSKSPEKQSATAQSTPGEPQRPAAFKSRPVDIHSAYGRRTPPISRPRSPSPEDPRSVTMRESRDLVAQSTTLEQGLQPYRTKKDFTCYFWQKNRCDVGAEDCPYTHGPVPLPPEGLVLDKNGAWPHKKQVTCYYWLNFPRGCKHPEEVCDFAHHDTKIYPRPLSWHQQKQATFRKPSSGHDTHDMGAMGTFHQPSPLQLQTDMVGDHSRTTALERLETQNLRMEDDSATPGAPLSSRAVPQSAPAATGRRASSQFPTEDLLPNRPPLVTSKLLNTLSENMTLVLQGADGKSIDLMVRLAFLNTSELALAQRMLGSNTVFRVDRFMEAQSFGIEYTGMLHRYSRHPVGEIVTHAAGAPILKGVFENCKAGPRIGIANTDKYSLIVFPATSSGYRAVKLCSSHADPSEASLLFRILPRASMSVHSMDLDSMDTSSGAFAATDSITSADLLSLDVSGIVDIQEDQRKYKDVFVMAPPDRETQCSVLADYFKSLGCDVKTSNWSDFEITSHEIERRGPLPGVLIIYRGVKIWEIPKLSRLLKLPIRVVEIGAGQLETGNSGLVCRQLFPYCEVVFITDDIFVNQPDQATNIIKTFSKKEKPKSIGQSRSRILTRPGIKAWLEQLVVTNTGEGDNVDRRWAELYVAVCQLCTVDDEDPWDQPNPLPTALLISPSPENMPGYASRWEEDEERATDYLLSYFAGWGVANAASYRRFIVCHEAKHGSKRALDEHGRVRHQPGPADPRNWAGQYQHLTVMTPTDWLAKRATQK